MIQTSRLLRPRPNLSRRTLLLLLFACAACTSCATVRPGTGDISFRLLWDGTADLDLHVVDPNGLHTGVAMSGRAEENPEEIARLMAQQILLQQAIDRGEMRENGILDIDCNADPTRMCKSPIENIFWPEGTAPQGTYEVWVHHFQHVEGSGAVPYVLQVRRGETVVQTVEGQVDPENRSSEIVRIEY